MKKLHTIVPWAAPRSKTAMLSPSVNSLTYFRRGDESIYAVLSPKGIRELKRRDALNEYLDYHRDSGVVIQIAEA